MTCNGLIDWTLGYFGIKADLVSLADDVLCINIVNRADVEDVRDYLICFAEVNNLRIVQDVSRFVVYS